MDSKILTFMSWTGECQQQKKKKKKKNTQHAPSTKMECDYLYRWIKKRSYAKKLTKYGKTPETQLETQKKKINNKTNDTLFWKKRFWFKPLIICSLYAGYYLSLFWSQDI